MRRDRPRLQLFAFLFLLLSSCKVGPAYKVPTAPISAAFKEPLPAGWKEAQPQETALRGAWWEIFDDPRLNTLEEQVDVSNQNIAAAEAQFRSSRAAVQVAGADLFPAVTVGATSTTSRFSSVRPGFSVGSGTFYQLPIDVSYEGDLWGRVRRNIEANHDALQAFAADLQTVRLTVHADLALDYFQLRGLDDEQAVFESTIQNLERNLQLTLNRYNQGVASRLDVEQARTQLETTRTQAIDVGVTRSQFEHAIAVLMGKPPAELTIAREGFALEPPAVPAALPSELLERRPDVAGAERRAASANAQIGVAKAAFFPQLTFSFSGGLQSSLLGNLLSWPSRFWSLGPSLSQIAFDAGRRRGLTDEAVAAYDAAVAGYRQGVLAAFQEVEDNLAALRILSEEAAQQDIATQASQRALDISLKRYHAGIAGYLDVIAAQNALFTNQRAAVGIRTRRFQSTVLLIEALGGGWDRSQLPSK